MEEAAARYSEILRHDPAHCDALHLLGVAHHQAGRHEQALGLIRQALKIGPTPLALCNYGLVLSALKRFDVALQSFDHAIALQPDYAEAFNNRGIPLVALQRLDEAVASYDRAIALQPDYAEAFKNRAITLAALRRFDEALASYDRAIALKPNYAEAFYNRGIALSRLDRIDEALTSYDRAIALAPDHAEAFNNRGNVLRNLNRSDDALASYDRALALKPGLAEALNNRGLLLAALERFDDAVTSYDRVLALRPDFAEAFNSRGIALVALKRFDEALASYDRAIALEPDYAEAFNNRGFALDDLRRFGEALKAYDQAIRIKPDYAEAHFNAAFSRLAIGDFEGGWREHEWRWKMNDNKAAARHFRQPLWTGVEDLRGRTILLHAEQGVGDTIQFCRYATLVAARGARVVLEVPRVLMALMRSLPGVVTLVESGQPLPEFDLHCPLLSLPLAFDTRLETIPAPVAYLAADPDKAAQWRERLGPATTGRVGLAWSGNATQKNDHNRSMPLATMLKVLPTGLQAFSLQKDVRPRDRPDLAANPHVADCALLLNDFSDTAALIAQLDLVIAVDTSVAHLAAAMGKPIWALLCYPADWRWLTARDDSPWYPTMRLFRQPAFDDWESVVAVVRQRLESSAPALRDPRGNSLAG